MTSQVVTPPAEFGTTLKDSCFDAYPPYVEGTTWLKPVPWDGIDKDEKKEIEEEIEIRKTKSYYYDPDCPEQYRNRFDYLKLTGRNAGEDNFVASPVLQVISVRICNEVDPSWKEFKIYGDISITDEKGNVFYIYEREEDSAETVSISNDSLSLKPCHFAPVMRGKVKFNLTKDDGGQIFDVESYVEYKTKDGLENHRFNGKDGYYALMVFTIIPYASIAKVGMFLFDAHPYTGKDETFGVYGRIKAKSSNVHGKLKDIEVICFEKSSPVLMWHGKNNYIEMSTPMFGVSVFSQLIFDLSLWSSDGTKLAVDEIDDALDPGERGTSNQEFYCDNEDFKLGVSLEWFSPAQFFENKEFSCKDAHVEWRRGNRQRMDQPTDLPFVDDQKLIDRNLIYQPTGLPFVEDQNLIDDESDDQNSFDDESHFSRVGQIDKPPAPGRRLVEVFSILVEGGDSSSPPLALSGSIVLRHRDETLYIFARSNELSDKLSSNEQGFRRCVSLSWSDKSWVEEKGFFMHLKLKDEKDNEVCRGYLTWYHGYDHLRHDRRLCEVILGKDGYFAAVHYSIFTDGLRAKVTVECYNDCANFFDSNCISVYGSVFAEYSNYSYPSTYDKEYYRSVIFKRSVEDRIFVKNGSEIPLSKSRVCAPSDCKELIVDVDLFVEVHPSKVISAPLKKSSCRRGYGRALGRIPFKAKTNEVCEIHDNHHGKGWGCENCCIRVRVDWF